MMNVRDEKLVSHQFGEPVASFTSLDKQTLIFSRPPFVVGPLDCALWVININHDALSLHGPQLSSPSNQTNQTDKQTQDSE